MAPEEPSCPSPSLPRQHGGSELHLGVPKHAAATRLEGPEGEEALLAQLRQKEMGQIPARRQRGSRGAGPSTRTWVFPLYVVIRGPCHGWGYLCYPVVRAHAENRLAFKIVS